MHPVNPSEKQGCGGGHSQRLDTEIQAATKNGDFPNQRGGEGLGNKQKFGSQKGEKGHYKSSWKAKPGPPKTF